MKFWATGSMFFSRVESWEWNISTMGGQTLTKRRKSFFQYDRNDNQNTGTIYDKATRKWKPEVFESIVTSLSPSLRPVPQPPWKKLLLLRSNHFCTKGSYRRKCKLQFQLHVTIWLLKLLLFLQRFYYFVIIYFITGNFFPWLICSRMVATL